MSLIAKLKSNFLKKTNDVMILQIYVSHYGYLPTENAVQIEIHIVAGDDVGLKENNYGK